MVEKMRPANETPKDMDIAKFKLDIIFGLKQIYPKHKYEIEATFLFDQNLDLDIFAYNKID